MGAYKRWSSISYDSYQNFRLSFSHFRRVSRFPYIQHPLLLFINWRNDSNQQHECSLTHSWMELEPKKKLPLKKFVGGTGKRTFVHKGFRFHFFSFSFTIGRSTENLSMIILWKVSRPSFVPLITYLLWFRIYENGVQMALHGIFVLTIFLIKYHF